MMRYTEQDTAELPGDTAVNTMGRVYQTRAPYVLVGCWHWNLLLFMLLGTSIERFENQIG
jgi:hypothetical protein